MWVKKNLYKITYKNKNNQYENILMSSDTIEDVIKNFKDAISEINSEKDINIQIVEKTNWIFYANNDEFII